MKFNIEFKPRAVKDLKPLPGSENYKILEKIDELRNDLAGDVKKLTNHTREYRLRIGDYRVLFEVEGNTVIIYRIYIAQKRILSLERRYHDNVAP